MIDYVLNLVVIPLSKIKEFFRKSSFIIKVFYEILFKNYKELGYWH